MLTSAFTFTFFQHLIVFFILVRSRTCTFENGIDCGFSQDTTDNFNWTLHNGYTASAVTGPQFDHTYGNATGHYMYIESSSMRNGDDARLMSPIHRDNSSVCLSFYYSMYGRTVGTLRVLLKVGNFSIVNPSRWYAFRKMKKTSNGLIREMSTDIHIFIYARGQTRGTHEAAWLNTLFVWPDLHTFVFCTYIYIFSRV